MHDFVHLRGQLLIEPRDHLLDRVEDVALDDAACPSSASRDQGRDRILDFGRGALGARLEALLQQRRELVGLDRLGLCASLRCAQLRFAMIRLLPYFSACSDRSFGLRLLPRSLKRGHQLRIASSFLS